MASIGHLTKGAAKVIVSDYRYFFSRKSTQSTYKIRENAEFLATDEHR
jgi:hypothetical protein